MKFYFLAGALTSFILSTAVVNLDSAFAQSDSDKPPVAKSYPKPKLRDKKVGADGVTGPMYYYSVTHNESTGWIYVIPFCKKMNADEFKTIKKSCKALSEKGQRCETKKKVELAEAGGPKKKSFALDYFVFLSERACVQDRESYTSGDVVPFH